MTADVNELSGAIAKILVILSLFILVFTLLTCFANVILFGKIFGKESKKKWLSFVPFVNDYIIYDTFWNTKMFALYIVVNFVMQVVTRFASEKSTSISVVVLLYMVATLIVLFLDIAIMTHIATSFGKTGFSNALWSIGLFALYPLFVVILAKKNEFTPEVTESIKKKAEEREKRKAEKKAEKEARKKEKKEAGL